MYVSLLFPVTYLWECGLFQSVEYVSFHFLPLLSLSAANITD